MGYVRSRKFCCCLPVRFGVFCMSLIGIVLGGLLSIGGWVEIHKTLNHELVMDHDQIISLWIVSITYTWMTLVSVVGFAGSIGRSKRLITFYAYTVTVNTLVIIAAGVYFIYSLFHKKGDAEVDKCVDGTTGDVGSVKHWVCQKGFDVLRVLVVVLFVIVWIFQLVGIAIVFNYVGQLREEKALEEDEERKGRPAWTVTAPTPYGPMRTTYDAAPYDPPMPIRSGWSSAKSPYAFSTPEAQVGGR